jgi:hypothetical protein
LGYKFFGEKQFKSLNLKFKINLEFRNEI